VPGTVVLNQDGNAEINSVSCASAGNCSAGGDYLPASAIPHAFVVSEVNGTWQRAEEVPGIATLSQVGSDSTDAVSCASSGNCSAGGNYFDSSRNQQVFVVSEVNGRWQQAEAVPGIAALNQGGQGSPPQAVINSMSCASAGNCSAGGYYTDHFGDNQAFVVSEVSGTWQQAREIPGAVTGNLDGFGHAAITSVSCAAAGNCTAGGNSRAISSGAFVVSEVNGSWQQAEEVPGIAALSPDDSAGITSVSCASAGNCSAGGNYADRSGGTQAFVVSEVNSTWQRAEEIRDTAMPSQGIFGHGRAQITSMSCASAGNCTAGGYSGSSSFSFQAFVVSEVNGTWQQAEQIHVPGTSTLKERQVSSVSCASAGNCSAGVTYSDGNNHNQAFVVSEVNGTWQQAGEVPGTATPGKNTVINSVSCAPAGICTAGGFYTDRRGRQAFVVTKT